MELLVVRMCPGARPPALDAVQSSLSVCLLVLLLSVEAAGSEGAVYNGGWQFYTCKRDFLHVLEKTDPYDNA